MVVDIRLYKRYDADLVALAASGCSISAMMYDAVIAYANGTPIHFLIDEITPFNINDNKTRHVKFTIPDSQTNAIFMLKNIRNRCKNSFCKALLRNSLIQQNLSAYFANESLLQLQAINLKNENIAAMQNVYLCSSYKKVRQVSFAGQTFTQQTPRPAISIQPAQLPYMGSPSAQVGFNLPGVTQAPTFTAPAGAPVSYQPVSQPYNMPAISQSVTPVSPEIINPYPVADVKPEPQAASVISQIPAEEVSYEKKDEPVKEPYEPHHEDISVTSSSVQTPPAEKLGTVDNDDLFYAFENL